jgi:hypothetical protein
MHRRFYEGSNSHIDEADLRDEHLQFALRQSNHAIQGLMKATSPGGHANKADKVTLMTCAVSISICEMYGLRLLTFRLYVADIV